MIAYVLVFAFSALFISFDNHDLITNFTSVAATLNNIGPGLEPVSYTHLDVYKRQALTFLVISCPCALVLSVPLAFFSGIGAGSKRGILFKGGISLEAMRNVNAVIMDKTGTLTEGNFVLQTVLPADSVNADTLLELCAACESTSTHPIAHSIVSAAQGKGMTVTRPDTCLLYTSAITLRYQKYPARRKIP